MDQLVILIILYLAHVSQCLDGGIGIHVVKTVIGNVHLVLRMDIESKTVTLLVVHVQVTVFVVVDAGLGIMAISEFKDKAGAQE